MKNLADVLANTYVLLLQTQHLHWNMEGQAFYAMHLLTEKQYTELFELTDEIAERMRQCDQVAPASLVELQKLATLKETPSSTPFQEAYANLISNHRAMHNELTKLIYRFQEEKDEGTADLLIQQLKFHDKAAWLLSSHKLA